jgi:aminopeptidase N
VVAGDYHVVTAAHTTPGGQLIPLELACRAGMAAHLDADALFEVTRQGLDFYTGLLGSGYPYRKYGQVFVPELSCLASEDAGCVIVSEQLLFRSRVGWPRPPCRCCAPPHRPATTNWPGPSCSAGPRPRRTSSA